MLLYETQQRFTYSDVARVLSICGLDWLSMYNYDVTILFPMKLAGRRIKRDSQPTVVAALSDQQFRYLALARLLLYAQQYRMILVDEPPVEELSSDDAHPYPPISEILEQNFKHCVVFIIAHNTLTLRKCDRIWLLKDGRLHKTCSPDEVKTQDGLLRILNE